jgi:hypothetical protein
VHLDRRRHERGESFLKCGVSFYSGASPGNNTRPEFVVSQVSRVQVDPADRFGF